MKNCPYCNEELPDELNFCLYCMTKLTEETLVIQNKKKHISFFLYTVIFALLTGLLILLLLWFKPELFLSGDDILAVTDNSLSDEPAVATETVYPEKPFNDNLVSDRPDDDIEAVSTEKPFNDNSVSDVPTGDTEAVSTEKPFNDNSVSDVPAVDTKSVYPRNTFKMSLDKFVDKYNIISAIEVQDALFYEELNINDFNITAQEAHFDPYKRELKLYSANRYIVYRNEFHKTNSEIKIAVDKESEEVVLVQICEDEADSINVTDEPDEFYLVWAYNLHMVLRTLSVTKSLEDMVALLDEVTDDNDKIISIPNSNAFFMCNKSDGYVEYVVGINPPDQY